MNNLGVLGEEQAVKYLLKNKYKILETNFKTMFGEIDIIAKIKNVIVFVEVKTRNNLKFGFPCESVTQNKQHKIKMVAEFFLIKNKLLKNEIRFDVIEILNSEIKHITNAF